VHSIDILRSFSSVFLVLRQDDAALAANMSESFLSYEMHPAFNNLLDTTFHLQSDCAAELSAGGNVAITLAEMEGMFVVVAILMGVAALVVLCQEAWKVAEASRVRPEQAEKEAGGIRLP
jgi:hypothetical protein